MLANGKKSIFAFIAFVGGPIINFPGHNQVSRQASASQVTLTDGVSPAPPAAPMSPVVSIYMYMSASLHTTPGGGGGGGD